MNSNKSNLLSTSSASIDNQTIAGSSTLSLTIDASLSNHAVLGVIGYAIGNASTSGINSSYCYVFAIYKSSSNTIVNVKNTGSSSAVIKVTVNVLYVAED